jgi:rod shape-determining protein MreC
VHDKQVRRRRAVLGLLVAVSLILLTAYFGESDSGPLHGLQRGVVAVLSPIQQGASTVLSPLRDVAGFVSSTFHAKSEVAQLRTENQRLINEIAGLEQDRVYYRQLAKLVNLDTAIGVSAYHPVAANVIGSDPSFWYDQIEVAAGSDQGVHRNQPVIGEGGLVGLVTDVTPEASWVTLITDHTIEVTAEVEDGSGNDGVLQAAVGNPSELVLSYLPDQANVQKGQLVVTAGFKSGTYTSYYPPGIPIGYVSNANAVTLQGSGEVQVSPIVNLRHLNVVQILTQPQPGTTRASTVP